MFNLPQNMDENFVVYTARDGRKLRIFVDKGCSGTFTEIATPPELAAFDASAANIGAEVCTAPPAATCAYTTPVQIMLIDKRIVVGVVLRKSTSSANSNNWNRLIMVSNAAGTTLTAVTMRPFFTFGSQSLYATMVDARFQFWSPVSGLWFATVLSPDTRGSDTVTQEPVITMRSVDYGLSWHYLDDTKLFTSCRFNPCGVYLLPHSAVARDGTSLLLTKATDNAVFKDYDLSWSTDKGEGGRTRAAWAFPTIYWQVNRWIKCLTAITLGSLGVTLPWCWPATTLCLMAARALFDGEAATPRRRRTRCSLTVCAREATQFFW